MNISQKLQKIADWTSKNFDFPINQINKTGDEVLFSKIEDLIEENLPNQFKELFSSFDGEKGDDRGILLGLEFLNLKEVISNLEFSQTMIKPEGGILNETDISKELVKEIVDFFINLTPKNKTWYKLEFQCSAGSVSGPYLYENENDEESRTIIKSSIGYEKVFESCAKLHNLEKNKMNWDQLDFIVLSNGTYKFERKETDWNELMNFVSFPSNSVRLKYFHYKWLPVFTDGGGNFIGIDLDPASEGKKGQIIIFGRDESLMPVIAEDLNSFFDFCIDNIDKKPEIFQTESHPHEVFKYLLGAPHDMVE